MIKRIYAIFRARNLEFLRDRGTLTWNIVLPVALMLGLSFIFSGDRPEYTVGVLQQAAEIDESVHPFLRTRYIEFVAVHDKAAGFRKIERHQLDLLVSFEAPPEYWINPDSSKGYFAELALLQTDTDGRIVKSPIEGDAVRYVDWVLPGILAMNMMFSCLFGVGYVVVRYRKNGFLKRLRATPLRAIEFVIAQVASRLILILVITIFVYAGTAWFLDTRMDGSYLALLVVALLGCITLISLGLLVAARVTSEELAGGLLNLATWPMMMLSGVWYSLESANEWVRQVANVFPLTHILNAARSIMLDGSTLAEVLPELLILASMSVVFLSIAASVFRWRSG
ncbi:MAG: ABC transporter permease [Gammaproteobacteria bacterium]|nr:ABC transporter permease [Gammaproteobacteria bacterium]MDH4313736.1 ABC transporter permease [Gammaproteobacteria bacterium]MDH5212980.1 ABC transporter permease [Gammaproteobacteria bacterium]